MRGLFDEVFIPDIKNLVCHSGGAIGSDIYWENKIILHGGCCKAYSYKTDYHNSVNKVEISNEDYLEGIEKVKIASKMLGRRFSPKYVNLTARNWSQVKYSGQIIAISTIKDKVKGIVSGGTGYAVSMGIMNNKIVNVFDQEENKWYVYKDAFGFIEIESANILSNNFAGIGTRQLNNYGRNAIDDIIKGVNVNK